ncbi:MAG: phage major capsid protein [Eubacterium sp.]
MAYDNIKLEKGLYTTGKSFTQALEKLDPSENYKGTSLEGLDAFERQLKRFDIKVSGENSDTISKFFSTTDAAVLFPEFISRAVKNGMAGNDRLENIVATTTLIDSLDYRSISLLGEDSDYYLEEIGEGEALPELTIGVKSSLTELRKFGKMITASYEAIKFQKLDVFSLALKKIGESISQSQFIEALDSIILDKTEVLKTAGSNFSYDDFVNLWLSFQPYTMTTLVANPATISEILKISEFKDANAGLDFHGTGKLITPFGAEIICFDNVNANTVIALDKNYAVEKVVASDVTTEFDKIIDRQLERAAVSTIVGFSPIFEGAVKKLVKS